MVFDNHINQTVDAEITVMMIPQRADDAEKPAENKSSNGPRRVQSKGASRLSILYRKAYVSCREYVSIPLSSSFA